MRINYFNNILISLKLISFFYVFGCSAQEQPLKLEILNNEIICRENFRFTSDYITHESDSIPKNKIDVKISNSGTKPYVLLLTNNFTGFEWKNTVSFDITNDKNVIQKAEEMALLTETMQSYGMRKWLNDNDGAKLKKELYEIQYKEDIDSEKIKFSQKFNYIIIHPNEVKFFTFYQGLPSFRFERPDYMKYSLDSSQKYYFQIVIKNDAESNKDFFYENQLREIKENGYEIFDGIINSNKVPIKFVK